MEQVHVLLIETIVGEVDQLVKADVWWDRSRVEHGELEIEIDTGIKKLAANVSPGAGDGETVDFAHRGCPLARRRSHKLVPTSPRPMMPIGWSMNDKVSLGRDAGNADSTSR